MFNNIKKFFGKFGKNEKEDSKNTAKERLHLVLAQDRANISADFLEMMKQEIIDVIKKYIDIDEEAIDVRMTNKSGEDGTIGAPALYANIPIVTIKNEARKLESTIVKQDKKEEIDDNKDKKVVVQEETTEKEQSEEEDLKTKTEQEKQKEEEPKPIEKKEQSKTNNTKEENKAKQPKGNNNKVTKKKKEVKNEKKNS